MSDSLYATRMGRFISFISIMLLLLLCLGGCAGKSTKSTDANVANAQKIVDSATDVLRTHLEGDQKVSASLLISKAKGMMIIPDMGSISFFFSFGGGRALMMARNGDEWTGPVFLSKGTGGLGIQAGVTKMSGLVLYMDEEDVRYVLETGAVMQGRAAITFLDADFEGNRTPEFAEAGEVVFIGDTSGLYAGIGVNAGGLSSQLGLNGSYHGVADGNPENILYTVKSVPAGAAHLRDLLGMADTLADKKTKKDGTEVPSN